MKVIAIGGNKLSRGLTLEGLMTTFYLRESKQFDTLLQMGRWFGYRKGYEDLVKIFTSKNLWKQFKELAIVEIEFRDSVNEMIGDGKTPLEFAPEVRHILGLLPTAKNKLGAAELDRSFGKKQLSVTRLLLDHPSKIDHNTEYTASLIQGILESGRSFNTVSESKYSSRLAVDVSSSIIKKYLNKFVLAKSTDDEYLGFDKDQLLKYINDMGLKGKLKNWNVAIISLSEESDCKSISIHSDINIIPVNRARLKLEPINGAYNIQGLSSKSDRRLDLPKIATDEYNLRKNALMLIYYIDGNSAPTRGESTREALYKGIEDKKRNPVAYSIIFPIDVEGKDSWKQPI
jgi:hypothetical protein